MDPNATAIEILRALIDGNKERATELHASYCEWREKAGFSGIITSDELMAELSNYF